MCHITVRKAMEKVAGVVKATVDYDKKQPPFCLTQKANVDAYSVSIDKYRLPGYITKIKGELCLIL